jgi:hypothetical protein
MFRSMAVERTTPTPGWLTLQAIHITTTGDGVPAPLRSAGLDPNPTVGCRHAVMIFS